jgi:hypothetical protein
MLMVKISFGPPKPTEADFGRKSRQNTAMEWLQACFGIESTAIQR